MEYLFGTLSGAAIAIVVVYFLNIINGMTIPVKIVASQSRTHEMMGPSLAITYSSKELKTQATDHYDSSRTRIMFTEENAYWIKDNSVYRAQVKDDFIVENTEEKLDIIHMDNVQLKEIMFIIEKLTEGTNNDSGNSGNSKF